MRENHLLSKGNLIEVGRGDLVGKYVGWTAPAIQKKFKEAEGSVLFIDEAYSLVDDRDDSTAMKRSIPLSRRWKTTGITLL